MKPVMVFTFAVVVVTTSFIMEFAFENLYLLLTLIAFLLLTSCKQVVVERFSLEWALVLWFHLGLNC
jgi:hypothetical protein